MFRIMALPQAGQAAATVALRSNSFTPSMGAAGLQVFFAEGNQWHT